MARVDPVQGVQLGMILWEVGEELVGLHVAAPERHDSVGGDHVAVVLGARGDVPLGLG